MNKLIIPPSPNWYSSKILVCAPDNTVIYGSRNDVVVIYAAPPHESADIKILGGIHSSRVVSVAINKNWGNPNQWAVTVAEDNIVQLLDITTCSSKISQVGHKSHPEKVVAAEFAGEDRVISVSEKGFIIIWKLSTNNLSSITTIRDAKVKVSTISVCPHASWLLAIGTKKGTILITDLKKSGRVMFRIKAHSDEIISLSWCPTPYNVFANKITKDKENVLKEDVDEVSLPDLVPQGNAEQVENNREPEPVENPEPTKVVDAQEEAEHESYAENKVKSLEVGSDSSTETLTEGTIENNILLNEDREADDLKICDKEGINDGSENTDPLSQTTLNGVENLKSVEKQVNKQEFLLASSGRGSKSIKVWRAGTDGLLEVELMFPKPYSSNSKVSNDRSWITVCWVTPRSLLSSASKAQLLQWRLGEDGKKKEKVYKPRLIHSDHNKQLFCITAPIRKHESVDDEDWRDKNLLNAWTVGSDRCILNTSLGCDHKTLACYNTIGGTITSLVPSPIDPTRIACGISDGTAKMLDLSRPHTQTLSTVPLYDKNSIKVTAFAWHPKKEACLAYGTQEGQVGLIDTTSTTKNVTDLIPSGHHPLYYLQWGPLNDDLLLYVISNSKLVTYDVKKPLNAPEEIDINNGIGLTSFAWKHDYSILAVATKNCELLLYDKNLKLISTFLLQSKTVRCMEWHLPGTEEENWLALSTNQIIVYDCNLNNLQTQNKYEECAVAVFTEHHGFVHCLSWSPHKSEVLASAGDFGMALVWNVKTKTLLHACVSQFDVFYNVVWSPLDPDYLITGGRGCVLKVWKLSEVSPNYKIDKAQQKQTLSWDKSKDSEELPVIKSENKQKRSAKCLFNGISQVHNLNLHTDMLEDCIKLFNSKFSKNYEDPHRGSKQTKNEESSVFNILDLFEGKAGVDEILKLERENHANRTTPLCLESISMWQGNIGDNIKNAMKCGSLNQWLVSIAPMVSYNLWQEACEAYAKQLSNESNIRPIESAYYFLACHKVEEAIEALCLGSYYREALILAKTRLSETDPLIDTILKKWAVYSTSVGKYEIAAQCYIVLNMLEDAAKVLFRRSDISILEFCVKLAEETGNEELINATRFRLNAFKSADNNQPDNVVQQLKPRVELELEKGEKKNFDNGTDSNDTSICDDTPVASIV